jgi:RNA polymerase sigma factor (sigma-70 family)
LTSILNKYQAPLLAMMRPLIERRLGQKTQYRPIIEDLRQEVYLRLAETSVDAVPPIRSLEGYVSRLARNVAVDWIRERQRVRKRTGKLNLERHSLGESPTPESLAIRDEELARMHRAMQQLPPSQQELLRLHFWNGYTLQAIATGKQVDYNIIRKEYLMALLAVRQAMLEDK